MTAVDRLYAELAGADGLIRGVPRHQYAEALDRAQAYQDRALAGGLIRNVANTGRTVPYAGPGPTLHSAYLNPDVQREHFLADPFRSGQENLRINAEYVVGQLRRARAGRDGLRQLGAAVHAVQDSYSGGHAWRDDAVYDGDPTAAVRALHVFTPSHLLGRDDGRNTHFGAFDQPPAGSGTARAAVEATYRILRAHELGRRDPERAELLVGDLVEPLLRAHADGVQVCLVPDEPWRAERDRRLERDKTPGQTPDGG
ncbi:hypothetical protein GCM10009741_02590 [Kribbella lupini]|uniref:S1/P1 nuclease n=1 Tax=Kribbella lupini TaxID=291602 RepID=A0ABP4KT54_9ACTN